jgi:hypothetical protein
MAEENREIATAEQIHENGNDIEKTPTSQVPASNNGQPPAQEQFSVFTLGQKRAIVLMGSLASFFSPLSSSIYFPALDTVAAALGVSISQIDLTVTTYLVSRLYSLRSIYRRFANIPSN